MTSTSSRMRMTTKAKARVRKTPSSPSLDLKRSLETRPTRRRVVMRIRTTLAGA